MVKVAGGEPYWPPGQAINNCRENAGKKGY